MIFNKKYVNDNQITHILYFTFYNTGVEFLNCLIDDVMHQYKKDLVISKGVVLDIIKYGILSNRVFVKHTNNKIYNKSNYNEILKILEMNFEKFLDFSNGEFRYHYSIIYTDEWKKELAKVGCWDG